MVENITQTEQTESTDIVLDNWTSLTSANDTQPDDVDPHEDVVRMIQIIGNPPIVLFGTVANLLTFITIAKRIFEKYVNLLLYGHSRFGRHRCALVF